MGVFRHPHMKCGKAEKPCKHPHLKYGFNMYRTRISSADVLILALRKCLKQNSKPSTVHYCKLIIKIFILQFLEPSISRFFSGILLDLFWGMVLSTSLMLLTCQQLKIFLQVSTIVFSLFIISQVQAKIFSKNILISRSQNFFNNKKNTWSWTPRCYKHKEV